MLSKTFTIMELIHLSLRVPEVGSVNFNILHTVLCCVVQELGVDQLKPQCVIDDEDYAKSALIRGRLDDPNIANSKDREGMDNSLGDIKEMLKNAQEKGIDKSSSGTEEEDPAAPEKESAKKSSTEKEEDTKEPKSSEEHSKDKDLLEEGSKKDDQEKEGDENKEETSQDVEGTSEKKEEITEAKKETTEVKEETTYAKETADAKDETTDAKEESVESKEKIADAKEETADTKEGTADDKERSSEAKEGTTEAKKIKDGKEETTSDESEKPTLQLSLPEITKDKKLEDITDQEKAEEVHLVAKAILEKTTSGSAEVMDILEGTDEEEKNKLATHALMALTEENIFESDPSKVVQEMWRAINITRRMDSAEERLSDLFNILYLTLNKVGDIQAETEEALRNAQETVDSLTKYLEKIQAMEKDFIALKQHIEKTDELTKTEFEKLKDGLDNFKMDLDETEKNLKSTTDAVENCQKELDEKVAYKTELQQTQEMFEESLESQSKELKKRIIEVEDKVIPKEDFVELVARTDAIEDTKVNKEELGRLLEPGFVDDLVDTQTTLQSNVVELKQGTADLGEGVKTLHNRIDDEVLKPMEASFAETNKNIDNVKEKLDTIDIDDIHDSFARLEEQGDAIHKDVADTKNAMEKSENEAKENVRKIHDNTNTLEELRKTKADKSQVIELLKTKADVDAVNGKLDRSEFISVIRDVKDDVERSNIQIKINEEEMTESFRKVRHELSLKMYTEDFIIGTEPIRNRIKAIIYVQEKIKEIALKNFFPDSPGITKCFSCKRAANVTGLNSDNPANANPTNSAPRQTASKPDTADKTSGNPDTETGQSSHVKLPPIDDINTIPIPPPEKPRIQDVTLLPVLFATATPQIGLLHEKRKKDIDNDLNSFFNVERPRIIGGKYTKTSPQQRGLSFLAKRFPAKNITLEGMKERYFKSKKAEVK